MKNIFKSDLVINEQIQDKLFILENIKSEIFLKRKEIEKIKKIDSKYCKMKFEFSELINIIEKIKTKGYTAKTKISSTTNFIKYNGNPYITLNICILAIIEQISITLDCSDNMLGTNNIIVDIINLILGRYKIKNRIYLFSNMPIEEVQKQNIVIVIDDINKYNFYKRKKIQNLFFYSLNSIDIYCDSEEFDDLLDIIYKYADNNAIMIESYSELNIEEAIAMIENSFNKILIILTKNEKTKQEFKKLANQKQIYINENPFDNNYKLIDPLIFQIS